MAGLCEGGNESAGSLKAIYYAASSFGLHETSMMLSAVHAFFFQKAATLFSVFWTKLSELLFYANRHQNTIRCLINLLQKDYRLNLYDKKTDFSVI
ncbi:hypothetical protein ANN_18561 [Periplaneta americana]|uniref:Uncharacterized protein n=1 Tax=Periplaneta americana TaxID=6978 RepID=A0ABQ8SP35_PERAM|nr:hypothetical protein ANN_18561 [Periplaneta americana]